ncbi:hypothetical protein PACTADRAFT_50355 [Pachysolen tannophilus NRRL Y-2460]|uniref:RNA polymerase Rpb4/RPC9 core domain-containing protein n=1 Tax=Pachysolen tannophilus NRRL Y-2460 TaxID=669874 RepID=A0A1E4TVH7_PACTA|nr:hypothetical protein PACTADRAFT_50355 [Pachysolen tannophilus NRRL Y-2460]
MNISTSTFGTRRRRRASQTIDDEENAAELKLGPEFQIDQMDHQGNHQKLITLNLSEARILIREALKVRRRQMRKDRGEPEFNGQGQGGENGNNQDGVGNIDIDDDDDDDETLANVALAPSANEVLRKTMDYLSTFSRFKDDQTVGAVESLLKGPENKDLHPFEIAQLGSLDLEESEEALSLIPSLNNKKSKRELQTILDELHRLERPY